MSELNVGKAVLNASLAVIFLVIAPYYLFSIILPDITSIQFPPEVIQQLMIIGIITSVIAFLRALFKRGTRIHGIINMIFALWFTFNLYYLFGGGLSTPGSFGIISQSIGYYNISVDFSFAAYMLIGTGILTAFVYLYEAIR